MYKSVYREVVKEIEKNDSRYVINRDGNVVLIRGALFKKVLVAFPPCLRQKRTGIPLTSIYTVFFHRPTRGLFIANTGASLLSKSELSGRYVVLRHTGLIAYLPGQGLEIIDVGVTGNMRTSECTVLRPESACSPGFVFGSQRCNCHDQWSLALELACEYDSIPKPSLTPARLERFLTSYQSSGKSGVSESRSNGQAFVLIHFSSQNGMGSGVEKRKFVNDITACAFMRHRGEYSAEQTGRLSVAGGFRAIGLLPDQRKQNNALSYRLSTAVLDYLGASKRLVVLTNNIDKIEALQSAGYVTHRIGMVARAGDGCEIEADNRRKEFGHLIPRNAIVSWKNDFKRIKKEIDALRAKNGAALPDYAYTKNLSHFLDHSGEDMVDSERFIKTLSMYHPVMQRKLETGKRITWLDVGTGPGTKPIRILSELTRTYASDIDFFALEPSQEWMRAFRNNLKFSGLEGRVNVRELPSTWEQYIAGPGKRFDLVTFFHSVYGIDVSGGRFSSFQNLSKVLARGGRACVVVESPASDLHAIKRRVWPALYGREPISSKTVESTLLSFGMKFLVDGKEPRQKYRITEPIGGERNSLESLSFIAQTQPENYNRIVPPDVKREIEKALKEKLKIDKTGSYIETPDRFIWVAVK
jgi:hypothetical protein